ncbi:hypothetical protein PF001_g3374 [Phytophthora fragariae]|uniref:Ubiquitin-like protease family profile domain-containing protein n=1 Tax=Phytophthora fragariae TaxID=53985 RepID=A0A6A4EUJ8_9STRA|nr:hypothetical protein PF001_g3374 [Phytophthora fragariae]
MSMAQCVEALVAGDKRAENEYKYRLSRIGRFVNTNYDEEMSNVLRFTTHFVAEQIEPQYAAAMSKAEAYAWTSPVSNLQSVRQVQYQAFDLNSSSKVRKKPRTHADRYKEAVRATHLIASELADLADKGEFDEMLGFVLQQWRNVRQKHKNAVEDAPVVNQVEDEAVDRKGNPGHSKSPVKARTKVRINPKARKVGRQQRTVLAETCETKVEDEAVDPERDASPAKSLANAGLKVRINKKARKVGRPQKQRSVTASSERADRKWYKAAEQGRSAAEADTLQDLLESLVRKKPGLVETQRRLSGVLTKYAQAADKKALFRKMKNPVLILDPFFVLPTKLLDRCMKVMPVRNTTRDPVLIDTDSPAATGPCGAIEVVQIKDIGSFSRQHIELMKQVDNLNNMDELGMDAVKWISEEALPALPAQYHDLAKQVGDQILHAYPYQHIDGLDDSSEYVFATLYRVIPPLWLSDACIRGLCDRLASDYNTCRFAGFQSVTIKSSRARDPAEGLMSSDVFAHWCCIVVKVSVQRIYCYDPLNQKGYVRAAKEVATYLEFKGLNNYDVVAQNNPIQFDQFSCGVFVCWMFMRQVVQGITNDMSDNSLSLRRFELFYYILNGRCISPIKNAAATAYVLPQIMPDEDKAPVVETQGSADEDIPPTQVAE